MIGRTLAHYEITAQLGKGGMGEVFRARDTKLDREVALKVLPTEMSGDPERKARFEREARSLASLQHPNVASIYGFEDVDGVRFLVMELVDGEDLSRRLEQGPVAPSEARDIALQIAAGLEAAHETGLVHRDLKPANVMVSPVGDVKILDFGLARAWFGDVGEEGDASMSPTITAAMTQAGTILGTAAYMSPEQARGRNVDRRADIWAFGVIVHEMLTGRRLFEAETISDTLAAVLRAEPDWSDLPTDTAPELSHIVRRCLQRDPRHRLRDIGEARILLDPMSSALGLAALPDAPVTMPPTRRRWPLAVGLAFVALVAGLAAGRQVLAPHEEPAVVHAMIPPPPGREFHVHSAAPTPAAPSPDGTMIVYGAQTADHEVQLFVRHLDQGEATMLSGTNSAAYPFWSPDSEYVGFFDVDGDKLRVISVRGGPATTLCAAANGKGGTWNEDGTILFAPSHDTPLYRVPDTGGVAEAITELGEDEDSHRHPRFLPGGTHYLYLARLRSGGDGHRVMLGSLDGGEARELLRSAVHAEYSAGHLLTQAENVLYAIPFDPGTGELARERIPVIEDLNPLSSGAATALYGTNRRGMLVFQTGDFSTTRTLQMQGLVDGGTTQIGEPGSIDLVRTSPDGQTAIVEVDAEGNAGIDLYMVDLGTGLRTRFSFGAGDETYACFTPDGKTVYYTEALDSVQRIVAQSVEGVGGAEVKGEFGGMAIVSGFTADGSHAFLTLNNPERGTYVAKWDLLEFGEPEVLIDGPDNDAWARPSPDGRWLAFHSTRAGSWEVFVVAADGGSRVWQLSRGGAVWPEWHPDGRSVLYAGFSGVLTRHEVDGSGGTLHVGRAVQTGTVPTPNAEGPPFQITPDGTRILVASPESSSEDEHHDLQLITWWPGTIRR